MKKKYEVLSLQTKTNIEGYGCNRWFKRTWWIWGVLFVVTFAWLVGWSFSTTSSWLNAGIAIPPIIIAYIIWCVMYSRAGKRFWKNIKDTEQPFDLREG